MLQDGVNFSLIFEFWIFSIFCYKIVQLISNFDPVQANHYEFETIRMLHAIRLLNYV